MASFTFDRPLMLSEKEAEKFYEIAAKLVKPDSIKLYSESERKESRELIKKWFKSQRSK